MSVVCGGGGYTGPGPGDPSNVASLTATATIGGINIRWTYPSLNPHAVAYTILYKSASSNWATAQEHVIVNGNFFFDQITQPDAQYFYYWIKFVSKNTGVAGAQIGPASALYGPTVDAMIDLLAGRIDSSVLAYELTQKIAQIQLNKLNITQEMIDRDAADDSIGIALNQVLAHSETTRAMLDQQTLAWAGTHEAFVTSINTWIASFEGGPMGGENITAAIQVETDARIAADNGIVSSFATQLTTVQSTIGANISSVQQNLQTQITEVDGVLTEIGALYTLVVDVNGLVGGFGVYNDGTTIDAGFNVDNFWIGRPGIPGGTPGVYPFIVTDNTVYIKSAMISMLTADQIDTRGLTVKDALGNVILGSGTGLPAEYLPSYVNEAITDFQASNNQNDSPVVAPTILTDGTAVDHTLQANGSADISLEWQWAGTAADIDGFIVYVMQRTVAGSYTFGTTPNAEQAYIVPANKRAFILFGVVPTAYYTFGVQAYRRVDAALGGIISSVIVKPTRTTAPREDYYQPSSTVAFTGNVTGTIDGIPAGSVNDWSAVTGAGKPEDNATAGADWGANIAGQPSNAQIMNNQVSLIEYVGNVSLNNGGAGTIQTITPNNKLASGNISNFMSSLAVGTLYIGNNAVTVPALATGGGATGAGASNFMLINSVAVTLDVSGYLYCHGILAQAFNPAGGTDARTWYLRLYINGALEVQVGGDAIDGSASVAKGKYVGAGTHSIGLYWAGKDSNISAVSSQLFVMGGKK